MNLGPQKISDTYQLVLNQSGSSVTLGNGSNPNWIGTTVASTTGTQTISGIKTFNDNTIFNGNITTPSISINNTASDASLEIGGNSNVYIDLKKPFADDYDFRIATDGGNGFLSSKTGLTFQTNQSNNRLQIDISGNTIIGPGSGLSLEVKGGIRAEGGSPGSNGSNNNGYAFTTPGDNDAGMFSSADGRLEFYTNNKERFRISGDKIGIGITEPRSILHASGEITSSVLGTGGGNFRMVGANYSAFFRNNGNNLYLLCTDSGNQYGSYNTLRPFTANLQNGNISMSADLTVADNITTNSLTLGTETSKATISYGTNTARTFTLPSVTADSTFAFINQAQTFTSNQVINADLKVQGNLDFGSSTLGGSAHSSFFKTNAGTLGLTAGNTLNLASIGFANNNQSSLSFLARRQSNGSDWTTAAIGLSYNVDNTTPVNNQQIWMLPDGKVGIGTNTPTQKLDINGNLKVQGSITCTDGIDLSNKNIKLAADVSIPTANTWYNIVSVSLEAGTWLINSSLLYLRTNNVADIVYCRISNGSTTYYASASENRIATNNATLNLSTTTIITLTSATTIYLQATQNTTAAANVALVKAAMAANGAGNNATQITAIRVN